MIVPSTTRTRADIVHALRYLKPVTGFRETFAYDNILYIVAGQLVEAVSGQTWEDFVRTHIFAPVGMNDAMTAYDKGAPNGVALHARTDGPIRGLGPQHVLARGMESAAVAPAGSINASAADMALWMQVQLAHGKLPNGGRLFSEEQAAEMWKPTVVVPKDAFSVALTEIPPKFQDYALGWFIEEYHGHTIVEHTGAVLGAVAALYLIPEKNVGVAVMINSEDGASRRAVAFHVLDHYLGIPDQDWNVKLKTIVDGMVAEGEKAMKASPEPLTPNDKSSLPLPDMRAFTAIPGTARRRFRARRQAMAEFRQDAGHGGAAGACRGRHVPGGLDGQDNRSGLCEIDVASGKIEKIEMWPVSPLADFSFDYRDLHFTPDGAVGQHHRRGPPSASLRSALPPQGGRLEEKTRVNSFSLAFPPCGRAVRGNSDIGEGQLAG